MTLAKRHAQWLSEHGISPAFARKIGIFTAEKPTDLPDAAGLGRYLPGCVFPWTSADGRIEYQVHPDEPPTDDSGRPRKYAFRSRKAGFETLLWALRPEGETALLVEGTKQSVAAANWAPDGMAVFGIAGVRMWQQDGLPIKDLAALQGYSAVAILLDGDTKTNQQVFDAGLSLKEALEAEGAQKVMFARMPAGDLDDWLSGRPDGERSEMLGRLVRHAKSKPADRRPKTKAIAKPDGAKILPDPQDPLAVARAIEPEYRRGDAQTLAFWRDGWYRWNGVSWSEVGNDEIEAEMWLRTEGAVFAAETPRGTEYLKWSPTITKITNLARAFKSVVLLPNRYEPPMWLDSGDDPGTIVALQNGLLTIEDRELLAHDPAYFNLVGLPFDYDPDAKCNNWLAFLDSVWPDGGDGSVDALQEWFGYVVSGRTDLHKILSIIGPTRSGKGIIAGTLNNLVGRANMAGPTMASFATNFGLQPLLGKSLAVIGDARIPNQYRDTVVERLLTISGQDQITVDRKYQQAYYGRLPVRIMILSNEQMRFIDMSGAIAGRFLALQTTRSFADNPDIGLRGRLDDELAGILNWSLDGYDRLAQQGRFTTPEYMSELMEEMRHTASPITEFVDDECVTGEQYEIETGRLWQAWNMWCLNQGRERTGTQAYFGRDLRAVVPGIRKVRGREGGERVQKYVGITLRDDTHYVPEGSPYYVQDASEDIVSGPEGVSEGSPENIGKSSSDLKQYLRENGSQSPGAGVIVSGHSGSVEQVFDDPASDRGEDIVGHRGHSIEKTMYEKEYMVVGEEDNNSVFKKEEFFDATMTVTSTRTREAKPARTRTREAKPARTHASAHAGSPSIIFDLETASADELYRRDDFIRLTGWWQGGDTVIDAKGPEALVSRMDSNRIGGHNIMAFDLPALARHANLPFEWIHQAAEQGRLFDTLIAARQDDPPMAREKGVDFTRRYDLDSLGEKFGLGHKTDALKKLAKLHGGFDKIPVDDPDYRRYLEQDLWLSARLAEQLAGYTGDPYVQREHRVAAIAGQIRHNGFRVDTDLLAERVSEVNRKIELATRYLHQVHGVPLADAKGKPYKSPLTTNAGKAAIVQALTELGVGRFWTTPKTGDIQMGKEAMMHLASQYPHDRRIRRLCRAVAIVSSARAIYQTIQDHLVGDRVHPEISLRQASGRWSYTGVNLAALGKRGDRYHERDVFLPEPGHLILAVDLSQVDMRAVAGLCGDPAYIELFRTSDDVHTQVAVQLFGSASYRQTAKQIGHGWNYGEAPRTIAERYEIPPATVRAYDQGMRESYPDLVRWQTDARTRAESGELLDNGFGRKMRPDPRRAWTQGPALEGQGAARDIMMEGLLRLPDDLMPLLRAQVHDEIVLSVPESDYTEVKQIVLDALQYEWDGPGGLSVPIEADASPSGRCWGDVYAKE